MENWKLWQDKCCFKVISFLIWEIYYEVLLFKHSIGEDWLRVVITLPCPEELVVVGEMEKLHSLNVQKPLTPAIYYS